MYKSLDEKIIESPLIRLKDDKTNKWNLINKVDNKLLSEIWFDNIGSWSNFKLGQYYIFGWDGLVFLESPIKTQGAYPYSVRATCYHYSSEGDLLSICETVCGIYAHE